MWKTFADDCQIFDVFRASTLSNVAVMFYFCVIASEEKRKPGFQNNVPPRFFITDYKPIE